LLVAGALALLLVALDWSRPPRRQWTVRIELAAIARYQAWVSPLLSRVGARCRFEPTCSRYAAAVIARDGALAGNARAAWRIARCGPWTPAGSHDPP
jgi:putative membrane protein insertion efficiency factor